MAHTTLTILLVFGVLISWSLFAFIIATFLISRSKELEIIQDIKTDVEHVKSEIKKLK